MNLLSRSLSPSGQPASTPVTSSRSKANRRANDSAGKSRHGRHSNLSPSGFTQPHMLFQLDADPVPDPLPGPSSSPKSFPWSRFQKQKSTSADRPYYDNFASAQSPDPNFDYFEYFSNYGKLSGSASASPIVSPDDPWSQERPHAADLSRSRRPPDPRGRTQTASFRPTSITFRKLFRRPGVTSPSSSVIDVQTPDSLTPPFAGPNAPFTHFPISSSSPPSPVPFAPIHAPNSSAVAKIKRYFSSPADASSRLVLPVVDPYVGIHQPSMPSLHNHQPFAPSYPLPVSAGVRCRRSSSTQRKREDSSDGRTRDPLMPPFQSRGWSPVLPDHYVPSDARHLSAIHLPEYPVSLGPPVPSNQRPSGIHNSNLYRISFIETNAYAPLDVPNSSSSPELTPLHHRFHKHLHGEWVTETVQELKKLFRPPSAQILVNVEKKSKYPFIIFGPLSPDFDTRRFMPTSSYKVLSPELRINDGIYDVCGSIFRPGSGFPDQDPAVQAVGFVISAFQTFPGEDSQRLEENWITWTGAQMLYKYLPISAGLRKLVFYKRHDLHLLKRRPDQRSQSARPSLTGENSLYPETGVLPVTRSGDESARPALVHYQQTSTSSLLPVNDAEAPLISYVLLCECLSLSEPILTSVCAVIDQLRARCCGYSALYVNCSIDQRDMDLRPIRQ